MSRWRHRGLVLGGLGVVVLAVSMLGAWRSLPSHQFATRLAAAPSPALPTVPILVPHRMPRTLPAIGFEDRDGRKRSLSDFHGKLVLLNVWATRCGPCRAEMPTLGYLQSRLGSNDFEAVALSIDRGGRAAVDRFFKETKLRSLGIYVDKSTETLARLSIVGIPTTLLLDRDGREAGRHTGPAAWVSPEAIPS